MRVRHRRDELRCVKSSGAGVDIYLREDGGPVADESLVLVGRPKVRCSISARTAESKPLAKMYPELRTPLNSLQLPCLAPFFLPIGLSSIDLND